MVTTFNSALKNSSLISNSKNIQEEEKSQVLINGTLTISLQTSLRIKQESQSNNDKSDCKISTMEEVSSLQLNTDKLLKEINELEIRNVMKKSKIDDLRSLVERISDEDYYFDRTLDHKRYFKFVKSFNYPSSQPKKVFNE